MKGMKTKQISKFHIGDHSKTCISGKNAHYPIAIMVFFKKCFVIYILKRKSYVLKSLNKLSFT